MKTNVIMKIFRVKKLGFFLNNNISFFLIYDIRLNFLVIIMTGKNRPRKEKLQHDPIEEKKMLISIDMY